MNSGLKFLLWFIGFFIFGTVFFTFVFFINIEDWAKVAFITIYLVTGMYCLTYLNGKYVDDLIKKREKNDKH